MASGTFNGSSTSMMAIYTRKGDKGETSLYETFSSKRKRVSKSSLRMESLGGIDELNSYLGICISYSENHEFKKILTEVQKDLLTTGSIIGGSKLSFSNLRTKKLEKICWWRSIAWESVMPESISDANSDMASFKIGFLVCRYKFFSESPRGIFASSKVANWRGKIIISDGRTRFSKFKNWSYHFGASAKSKLKIKSSWLFKIADADSRLADSMNPVCSSPCWVLAV